MPINTKTKKSAFSTVALVVFCLTALPGALFDPGAAYAQNTGPVQGEIQMMSPASRARLMRDYQEALATYKEHRALFQQNITRQPSGDYPVSGVFSSKNSNAAGNTVDYKMPRLKVPDDSPFVDCADADFRLTQKEEALGQAIPALLASRNKVSDGEYASAWKSLVNQMLSIQDDVKALDAQLAVMENTTSRKVTDMIHNADRDGIQNEYMRTFYLFKQAGAIENELNRRSDRHTQILLNLKSVLRGNMPNVNVFNDNPPPVHEAPNCKFLEQDLASQQAQLNREYNRVQAIFTALGNTAN